MNTSLERRAAVIAAARVWIGTPYRHQASLKGVGCDCLGLIRGVWRGLYGGEPEEVPAYAEGWAEAGAGEILAQAFGRYGQRRGNRGGRSYLLCSVILDHLKSF